MKWTVGQRITVGYTVILVLLVVVAGVGYIALSHTAETFETVIHAQERDLGAVRRADGAIETANLSFLRYLLVTDKRILKDFEEAIAEARRVMTELRDQASIAELKTGWGETLNLLTAWEEAVRPSIEAQRAGRHADALRIRARGSYPSGSSGMPWSPASLNCKALVRERSRGQRVPGHRGHCGRCSSSQESLSPPASLSPGG